MMLTKKVRSAQPLFLPIIIDIPFTGTKEIEERKEVLQDKRDRIRMGLLPPDAPKGKHLFVIVRQPPHHVPSIYSATGQSYENSNVRCRQRPDPSRGSCET